MRKRRASSSRGFTLIEALVALAVMTAMLASIGTAVAVTVRGTRGIDERLAAASAAHALTASLLTRATLQIGRTNGQANGFAWQMDVSPMALPQQARWQPVAIDLRIRKPGGGFVALKTVRLIAP